LTIFVFLFRKCNSHYFVMIYYSLFNVMLKMIDKQKIEAVISKTGLSDYKWMDPQEVIVSQWVRVKCMFG